MERPKQKETRICEKGLQIEYCRQCLFEILCNLEKQKASFNRNEK